MYVFAGVFLLFRVDLFNYAIIRRYRITGKEYHQKTETLGKSNGITCLR